MKKSLDKIILSILILLIYLWDILDAVVPEGTLILMFMILLLKLATAGGNELICKKSVLLIVSLTALHAIVCIVIKENSILLFLKAFTGIIISYAAYSLAMKKYSVEYLFEKYFKISVFVAAFGLFQELAFFLKWTVFYDKSYLFTDRTYEGIKGLGLLPVSCFFQEPSFLAFSLISAAYVSICIFLKKDGYFAKKYSKTGAAVILACCLLSFSSTVYLGILASFIFCGMDSKKIRTKIWMGCLLALLFSFFYFQIDLFRLRVDDMLKLLSDGEAKEANLSSRTLFVNMKIAAENFFRTFGLGSGLGSYKMVYYKLADLSAGSQLNAADGNSLFNRITAELGLAGLAGAFLFLKKNIVLRGDSERMKVINFSCIVCFLTRLLRNGHYFHLGFLFFIVLFVQSKRESCLSDKAGAIAKMRFDLL